MSEVYYFLVNLAAALVLVGGPMFWLGWMMGGAAAYRKGCRRTNEAWRRALDKRLAFVVPEMREPEPEPEEAA